MSKRIAQIERKSKETEIKVDLNIDGEGKSEIKTQIGFLDHMLELFSFHGLFDLILNVQKSDLNIDFHHTNEDVGIVLGKAFKKALGEEKKGVKRFATAFSPMESTLGRSVVDICGRGYLRLSIDGETPASQENYSWTHLEHFLESFAHNLGATIHIRVENANVDLHTTIETVFKSLGLALDKATQIDPRRKGVPSTKGIID